LQLDGEADLLGGLVGVMHGSRDAFAPRLCPPGPRCQLPGFHGRTASLSGGSGSDTVKGRSQGSRVRDQSFAVFQPGTLFAKRYQILRCIKAGGMGAVYEVTDERTTVRRALKVMLPELAADERMRERFTQ